MPIIAAGQTVILREPADHTAAWLAFVGAVLVALIAAGTAQWRLRRQLSDEAKRLKDQLDEESGRLTRQLEHDRQMSDTADLRHVLQRTFDVYEERRKLIEQMHWVTIGSDLAGSRPLSELTELMDTSFKELQSAGSALRIRLGVYDTLYRAVIAVSTALKKMADAVHNPAAYDAGETERATAYNAAVTAASARVGSRLG